MGWAIVLGDRGHEPIRMRENGKWEEMGQDAGVTGGQDVVEKRRTLSNISINFMQH